jgi:hypothetical protein
MRRREGEGCACMLKVGGIVVGCDWEVACPAQCGGVG